MQLFKGGTTFGQLKRPRPSILSSVSCDDKGLKSSYGATSVNTVTAWDYRVFMQALFYF